MTASLNDPALSKVQKASDITKIPAGQIKGFGQDCFGGQQRQRSRVECLTARPVPLVVPIE